MKSPLKSTYLSEYLKPAQIVFNLKATNKIRALEELLDVLFKQKLIKNKKLILTRIIDRERLESTAIGHHVALPRQALWLIPNPLRKPRRTCPP